MQIDRLIRAIRALDNPSALGLDTRVEFVPEAFARPYRDAGGPAEAVRASYGLLDHPWARKADQSPRFRKDDIAKTRKTRRHSACGRICQHRYIIRYSLFFPIYA